MTACVQRDKVMGVKRESYWNPFIEAVQAMALHDLLIWDVPDEKRNSGMTRLADCQHSEFKTFSNWYEGKLFIVRVR